MRDKPSVIELVPNRLYFASVSRFYSRNTPNTIYITADESEYPGIQSYFGPPSIADVYKYCSAMEYLITNSHKRIIHWSSYNNPEKYTNSIFLIGTFLLLHYHKNPEEVIAITNSIGKRRILSYCDTTNLKNQPMLQMKYFFYGLDKCTKLNWFDMETFNVEDYDQLTNIAGGDMNWIVPGKLLALSCPLLFNKNEYIFLNYFKRKNVMAVVQLNGMSYDRNIFRKRGIQHYDLHYADGSVPNKAITKRFLTVAECTPGAIAVHCRAGLGRTGTLIGAYIIKHYDLTALETTAWIRLCRPGSVLGLQQRFLQLNEQWLKSYELHCDEETILKMNQDNAW